MASYNVSTVGGYAHSGGEEIVVGNIGKQGTRFAGTFIGRTAYEDWDFVMSVYTDKDSRLYVVFVTGDTSMDTVQLAPQSVKLQVEGNVMGTLKYDPASGDLSVAAAAASGNWLQGALTGMIVTVG